MLFSELQEGQFFFSFQENDLSLAINTITVNGCDVNALNLNTGKLYYHEDLEIENVDVRYRQLNQEYTGQPLSLEEFYIV